jgi:hypothetical protein
MMPTASPTALRSPPLPQGGEGKCRNSRRRAKLCVLMGETGIERVDVNRRAALCASPPVAASELAEPYDVRRGNTRDKWNRDGWNTQESWLLYLRQFDGTLAK